MTKYGADIKIRKISMPANIKAEMDAERGLKNDWIKPPQTRIGTHTKYETNMAAAIEPVTGCP